MYYLEEEDRSTMERKPKLLLVMGLLVGNLFFSSDHLGSHWSTLEPLHMLSTDHWTGLVDWTGGLTLKTIFTVFNKTCRVTFRPGDHIVEGNVTIGNVNALKLIASDRTKTTPYKLDLH